MSESLFRERSRVCPECEGNGTDIYDVPGPFLSLPGGGVSAVIKKSLYRCWKCRGAGYVVVEEDAA